MPSTPINMGVHGFGRVFLSLTGDDHPQGRRAQCHRVSERRWCAANLPASPSQHRQRLCRLYAALKLVQQVAQIVGHDQRRAAVALRRPYPAHTLRRDLPLGMIVLEGRRGT